LSGTLLSPASAGPKANGTLPDLKDYVVREDLLPFEAAEGATAYWGVLDEAGYRIEVPDNWNGDLVMWAHGYAGTDTDILPSEPPPTFRPTLLAQGYAWAASTYSKNDYNIATPAMETRDLAKRFAHITGEAKPGEIYLAGVSMGGNITAYSAERYKNFYTGVMPVCGVLAERDLFDYFLDFNLVAQELGGVDQFPITADPASAGTYLFGNVPVIKANLEAVQGGWPVALNEDGQNLKDLTEIISGGVRPNFDEGWIFWNSTFADPDGNFLFSLGIDSGTVPIEGQFNGNADTVYQFDDDPALSDAEAALNASVRRVELDRLLNKDRREIPAHTGNISVPMLTMHNLGDLFVPFFNEPEYAARVASQGDSDLLVQRAIRGVLHCDFTAAEYETAFTDLVNWAENGVKPEGDGMDPASIAAPSYGCKFTEGDHLFAVPCGGGM
ncbi:MAG: alpha/beta hydrolase, partial [Acidimicrobiales bacterium]|nr:alpha/beta hydrolase [Acidimicrobiales bacterium]